jgi:hypothetical protein
MERTRRNRRAGRSVQWLLSLAIAMSFVVAFAVIEAPIAEGASCESQKCLWTSWGPSGYCCSFLGHPFVQQYREQVRVCFLRQDPDGTCIYQYCGFCPPVEFRCTATYC